MARLVKVLAINLAERQDRWQRLQLVASQMNLSLHRIEALAPCDVAPSTWLTPEVHACMESHRLAWRKGLSLGCPALIVVEDDFVALRGDAIEVAIDLFERSRLDVLQFGFLSPNFRASIALRAQNGLDLAYRAQHRIQSLGLGRERRFARERSAVHASVVLDDIRAGAHAYIVRPDVARQLVQMNSPAFLAADDFLIALSRMRTFAMARTRVSMATQDGSQTSMIKRFVRR